MHVSIEVISKQLPKNILSAQMRVTLYSKAFMVFQAQLNHQFVSVHHLQITDVYQLT